MIVGKVGKMYLPIYGWLIFINLISGDCFSPRLLNGSVIWQSYERPDILWGALCQSLLLILRARGQMLPTVI